MIYLYDAQFHRVTLHSKAKDFVAHSKGQLELQLVPPLMEKFHEIALLPESEAEEAFRKFVFLLKRKFVGAGPYHDMRVYWGCKVPLLPEFPARRTICLKFLEKVGPYIHEYKYIMADVAFDAPDPKELTKL